MDNNGIACTLNGHEGRVKNLSYDPINDEIRGDFYYRGSNTPTKTNATKLVGSNNKAKKALQEEFDKILERQKRKEVKKEPILS